MCITNRPPAGLPRKSMREGGWYKKSLYSFRTQTDHNGFEQECSRSASKLKTDFRQRRFDTQEI